MNIIEEGFQTREEVKNKKSIAPTIVLILIILVVFMIIGIITYMAYLENSELKIFLNGETNTKLKQILKIEKDGTVYMPIKEIASYLGYESYNGEYGDKSEELSKCYIESENEIANFSLGSNKIYKLDLTQNSENYEYVYINTPIKAIDGVLYATSDAIEKSFNIDFEYDQEKNRIYMYTTPYLVEAYKNAILDYGYTEISESFVNQKAISQAEILVVKSEKEKYGVIDTEGNVILEPKYDEIEYLPNTGDFLIKSNEKYGVISKSKEMKVQIMYDSIELMDSDAQLYVVTSENKYGVIDFNGKTKIYIENDEIGIDISKFSKNGIKNNYILADNFIPVKKGEFWGLYNKNGKQLVDFKYDSFGYIANNNKDALNLLVIPDYNVLVACKDEKYTLLNSSGQELFAAIADDIYMTINGGKTYYYIMVNNNQLNAIEFLDSIGIKNGQNNSNSETEQETNSTNTQNRSEENSNEEENNENQEEQNEVQNTEEQSQSNEQGEEQNQEQEQNEEEQVEE